MFKLLLLAALSFFAAAALQRSWAQDPTTPVIYAGACAYSTSPAAPVVGQFYLIQCNSSGQLIGAPH